MNLGLKDRVAVVAASSSGLGRAVAERLAHEGAHITICSRDRDAIVHTAREIAEATGAEVFPVAADVTREEDVAKLVEQTVNQFGRLDCLVTNAGGPPSGGFAEHAHGLDTYRKALELNLLSTVALCQAAVPAMRRNAWGRIVAVTSISAKQPSPSLMLSSMARAGVLAFVKSLATELAHENINVNAVCPGYTKTERLSELTEAESARRGVTEDDVIAGWASDIPARRLADPAEFADVVAFLLSDRASYVTGVALSIDGGFVKSII